MASNQVVVFLAMLAIVVPTFAMATEFIVGDSTGWTINFKYDNWTKDKVFWVGDKLVFHYDPSKHNVMKVDGAGFQACAAPAGANPLMTGNDTITLSSPGKKWYICGKEGHCSLNQKLVINVLAKDAAPAPAPSKPAPSAPAPSAANGLVMSGYRVFMAAIAAAAMIVA